MTILYNFWHPEMQLWCDNLRAEKPHVPLRVTTEMHAMKSIQQLMYPSMDMPTAVWKADS